MNELCESVNEKKIVSLAVNKVDNKIFENNEQMMSFGSPEEFDADVGNTAAFSGSTSVNFGSLDVFDADVGNTAAFAGNTSVFNQSGIPVEFAGGTSLSDGAGSTSVNFWSPNVFNADVGSTVAFTGSPSVFNESRNPNEFAGSTGVFDGVGKTIEVMEKEKLKKMEKLKQDDFEQGRVLERVAQTPLILAGVYDTHYSMGPVNDELSHGRNENSVSHGSNENSESASLND